MQQQTDTVERTVIPPTLHDVALIAPTSHIPESPSSPILHGTPLEKFIAPNVPFPRTSTSAKTRPISPLTRSKTTARAAATTASLVLAPDGTQLTYAKAIRGDEKAQRRKDCSFQRQRHKYMAKLFHCRTPLTRILLDASP